MSKKFKGKLCVYCASRPSETVDHVFARQFFLVKHRDNLPQAPACGICNGEKSALEHYLATVLPFGARHRDAAINLQAMVPKRLEKNVKLRTELAKGYTGEKIPFDGDQVNKLFVFVARGLLWHHWQEVLTSDDSAAATVMKGGNSLNLILSRLKPRDRVSVDLGEGTFIYQGLRTIDSPKSTIWRFLIYGGLHFGDSSDPNEKSELIFAVTGPRAVMPGFWATVFREKF